jgi:hypothetical protein
MKMLLALFATTLLLYSCAPVRTTKRSAKVELKSNQNELKRNI